MGRNSFLVSLLGKKEAREAFALVGHARRARRRAWTGVDVLRETALPHSLEFFPSTMGILAERDRNQFFQASGELRQLLSWKMILGGMRFVIAFIK